MGADLNTVLYKILRYASKCLEGKDNKAGYIKGLIKADYEKHKKQEEN